MVINTGPRPHQGRTSTVKIIDTQDNEYPLMVVPGAYQVEEAQRFGDKISVGPMSYQDFNPYESASVSANFRNGYGLRRYSEYRDGNDPEAYGFIKESLGVDTRNGVAILSPLRTTEVLPNSTAPVIWMGEASNGVFVAVCEFAGRCVYTRAANGTWTQAVGILSFAPVRGAIGVFNGRLIIGFGSAGTAVQTTDNGATYNNVGDGTNNIHVFAYTADRAAAYIAGAAGSDANKGQSWVMSSVDGSTFVRGVGDAAIVKCGDPQIPITSLAPGGGLATVYVGKQDQFGMIDTSNVYRTLMPFESRLTNNGRGLRWWMARGEEEQRGPMVLIVPRDRQIWAYAPSSQTNGEAQNMTPWADPDLRPPNVRGETIAIAGTARWLYYSIEPGIGGAYILVRDARTGRTSPLFNQTVACQALAVTSLFGTNPILLIGFGNNVQRVTLPLDSEWAPDDPECEFASAGSLFLPDIDLGFVSEPKVLFSVQAVGTFTDDLTCQVRYALDGGALQVLGTARESPEVEIAFDNPRPSAHTLSLQAILQSSDSSATPQLEALVVRMSINPKLYRMWSITVMVPPGAGTLPSDMLKNPKTLLTTMWRLRREGTPITFVDRWRDRYQARILKVMETEVMREPDRAFETALALQLLEVSGSAGPSISTTFQMDEWDEFWFPMSFPGNDMGPSQLTGITTTNNQGTETVYPIFTITGPAVGPVLTNNLPDGSFRNWVLDREVLAGEVLTINFHPSKRTVTNQDNQDFEQDVTDASVWWGLEPGINATSVSLAGATDDTRVVFTREV
jgi:hypothetical protein